VSIPREEAETKSAAAFKFVFENGPKIDLDHHIVYYARELFSLFCWQEKSVLNWNTDYEYGRLLRCQGKTDEAREQFELVLSGKTLEVGPSGRKGKYSMEVGFFHCHRPRRGAHDACRRTPCTLGLTQLWKI